MSNHPAKNPYTNVPLPRDNSSIRLLDICPTLGADGLIRCILRPTRLDLSVKYEALSYCWGDPKGTEQISVNDESFEVTKNLFSALGVLRRPDAVRTMWIDAICINQKDNEEKNSQVGMMREIYSRSVRVIIWLGSRDFSSHEAMYFLHNVAGKLDKDKTKEMERARKALRLLRGLREAERPLSYFAETFLENDHSSVVQLLQRPWFRRIWIVQEVAFAPEAVILCGKDSMDWDSFVDAVFLLDERAVPLGSTLEKLNVAPHFYFKVLSSTRQALKKEQYFSLRETLRCFQPFESSEPVDKIFALRGLLKQPEQIAVNYGIPVDCVYRDAATSIIHETGDLSILIDCHHITAGPKVPTIPSWVPDWSASGQHRTRALTAVFAPDSYRASLETAVDMPFRQENHCLWLPGLKVDEITQIGRKRPQITELGERYWPKNSLFPKENMYGFVVDCCDTIREWRELALEGSINTSSRYPTGETHHEVFWQTWLQPESRFPSVEAARKLKLRIKSLEWQFQWLDWFVRKISKTRHWLFIWSLFIPYLLWFSIVALINYRLGRLSFETAKNSPDPTQSEKIFGRTKKGLLAFLPATSRAGDSVIIFKGGTRPFIIRAKEERWQLVGAAYVHGVMYGGAFDQRKVESFCLV